MEDGYYCNSKIICFLGKCNKMSWSFHQALLSHLSYYLEQYLVFFGRVLPDTAKYLPHV